MSEHEFDWAGDYGRDLLRQGILEAKAGNREAACRYLDRALYMSGDHEVLAEAWYWMSQVSEDAALRRRSLENCLALDLQHARARRDLALLDGKLRPQDIIDPDAPGVKVMEGGTTEVGRFMCPRCGGRMTYSPDGGELVCEYCQSGQPLKGGGRRPQEEDFLLSMATKRGHTSPLREQVLRCKGCGAEFILPAAELAFSCAYCGSPHVVSVEKARDLIAPNGIVPHAFERSQAAELLAEWLESRKVRTDSKPAEPRGLYLPAWTFRLSGSVSYTGEVAAAEGLNLRGGRRTTRRVSDRLPVMESITIAASRRPSAPFVRLLPTFDLGALRPYDPRFLSAWPAELYDISMADASLEARSRVYRRVRAELPSLANLLRVLSSSSADLAVESFQLDLLPVWAAELHLRNTSALLLINGQSGAVEGPASEGSHGSGSVTKWLSDLIGGG
jgi:predicted RNA-binding Zn-ribbon protein involved in translation (DUF1610 family)